MYGHAETQPAVYAETSACSAFIRRTYGHLAGAVLAFMTLEAYLLQWSGAEALVQSIVGGFSWLLVLGFLLTPGLWRGKRVPWGSSRRLVGRPDPRMRQSARKATAG